VKDMRDGLSKVAQMVKMLEIGIEVNC